MLIQALKKRPKDKITPEAVQKLLATQNWQIKGLVGPVKYPARQWSRRRSAGR